MGQHKPYSLRTRDMYHPMYSTYQLDYLRPNVWEIVIGTNSPTSFLNLSGESAPSLGRGNAARQSSGGYADEGHNISTTFSSQAAGGLSMYCSKFTLNLPKSNIIQVPWISGVTQLAGRNKEAFTITAEFYAGLGAQSLGAIGNGNNQQSLGSLAVTDDILRLLYAWRNLCFDARSGQIGLAPNYKKPATIFMYDPSGVKIIYEFTVQGLWPSEINNIELDVSSDDIVKLSTTMQADFVYMADDSAAMDDFFKLTMEEAAGSTSANLLYEASSNSGASANSSGTYTAKPKN